MWTPQFIGLSVGCFLMIVAIMGGGVEVKEIKIPRLSGGARFGSALLGAAIALASSGYNSGETQAAAYSAAEPANASVEATNLAEAKTPEPDEETNSEEAKVEAQLPPAPPHPAGYVTIIDELTQGQEYERIEVAINGEPAGQLAIDQSVRMARLRIPADNQTVRYHLQGRERGFQSEGVISHRLEGRGTVTLRPGAVFEVNLADQQDDPDDDILQIDLRPVGGDSAGQESADGLE